jgi:hypothetical protein
MPNYSLAPYTPGGNGRIYANTDGNYQASCSTVTYTNPIQVPDSSAGFLSNHAYRNMVRYNGYGQLKADGFGYETPLQFPFRP